MSPISIFGGFVATGAFLFLFFLLWPFTKPTVVHLDMPRGFGQVLVLGMSLGGAWLLARLFPLRWGGLYLLGIGESRMRTMMRDILKECDPETRLRQRKWSVPSYETMVSLSVGFGKTSLVLHFRGNYAEDLIQVFLPTLRMDFEEEKVSGGYPRLRLALMLLLGIPLGIAILVVFFLMVDGIVG